MLTLSYEAYYRERLYSGVIIGYVICTCLGEYVLANVKSRISMGILSCIG